MLVDIRLRNTSQLAGFAKRDDLSYVLERCGIGYEHLPEVAPTDQLLDTYRETKDWGGFEAGFRALLAEREPMARLEKATNGNKAICLLCSEAEAEKCHRRLVAEYMRDKHPNIRVVHL